MTGLDWATRAVAARNAETRVRIGNERAGEWPAGGEEGVPKVALSLEGCSTLSPSHNAAVLRPAVCPRLRHSRLEVRGRECACAITATAGDSKRQPLTRHSAAAGVVHVRSGAMSGRRHPAGRPPRARLTDGR